MTYTPKAFSTLNTEGVDVNAVYTVSTATSTAYQPEYPMPPFSVGTEVLGNNGSKFLFTTVSTSCSKGNVCVVSDTSYDVVPLVTSIAAANFGLQLGVAMATGTTGQYLFVQTQGQNQAVSIVGSTTAGVPLYSSTTAGALTSVATVATSFPVYGVVLYTTATSAQVLATAQLTSLELGVITATAYASPGIAF